MSTRTLILDTRDLWALQQVIRDNTYFIAPGNHDEKCDPVPVGRGLCMKVRDAIIRLSDEELESLELEFSDDELWLIDRHLPFAAYKGAPALLEQVFRVMLENRLGLRTMSRAEAQVQSELAKRAV